MVRYRQTEQNCLEQVEAGRMLSYPVTRGIRGAITVDANTEEAIIKASYRLVREMMARNQVVPEDIATIIFSVTQDLDAAFPAAGARQAGLTQTALLCTNEVPVPGSLPRCIRALMLVTTNRKPEEIQHVYLEKAATLRPDLARPSKEPPETKGEEQQQPARSLPSYRQEILNITPYVPGKPISELEREKGLTDIIKLASNENPLGPSPKAIDAVRQLAAQLHIYPDGNCHYLRRALAEKLAIQGDQLLFGNGSDEIIKMLGLTFLQPGDEVLFCTPTFSEYAFAAHLMGARIKTLPLKDYAYDLEAMAQALTSKTKLVFICNPNNPTGAIVDKKAVEKFMARVPDTAIVVFDEAYYEYVTANNYPDTLQYVRENRNVIILRTFSKIYGLAGTRIGYGIAPASLVRLVRRVREPFNINAVAQVAAIAALSDEEHIQRSRKVNEAGKKLLYEEFSRLKLPYVPTQTNFIFVDIKRDSRQVYESLLDKGVIVRTGDIFGCPTWLRVTIGTEEQNRRFLTELEAILTANKTTTRS